MTRNRPIFSAFADSRTGNRGAVSMLESAIDHLTSEPCGGIVNIFTVYPKQDRSVPPTPNVHLFGGTPANLAFKLIPLCLLYRAARALRLPIPNGAFGKEMKALIDTDVALLIGGTTFSDAKQFKVPYNVACILPAIILGKKSVMYSQTLGPFEKWFNRVCARFCLSRVDVVIPRGEGSEENVKKLGFAQFPQRADAAFTLKIPEETEKRIKEKYASLIESETVVGISINTIVEKACRKIGIDHSKVWSEFIQYLQRKGYFILLIPHSMRQDSQTPHNNDLVSIRNILDIVPSKEGIHVIDEPYNCKELRVAVGLADYYVASRFHSMISALCTETPVLVFGWGFQKYREVLKEFDLTEYCHDATELSTGTLIGNFEKMVADGNDMRRKITENLPRVRESSNLNHLSAMKLATEHQ